MLFHWRLHTIRLSTVSRHPDSLLRRHILRALEDIHFLRYIANRSDWANSVWSFDGFLAENHIYLFIILFKRKMNILLHS